MNSNNPDLHPHRGAGAARATALGLVALVLVLMSFVPLTQAQTGSQRFDHITTGFPLTGMHARIDCESCHISGIFRGTPRQCRACHARGTRISATLPPEDTIHNLNQQTECNQCHRTAGWTAAHFEHLGITDACLRCHQPGGGGRSAPRDKVHTQIMGADCSECHRSTRSFASGAVLDHSGISSGCETSGCHARDRVRARGHAALAGCESCHSYPSWSGVHMDHNAIGSTRCRTCHIRGGNAIGPPSDPVHANIGSSDCSACHSTANFTSATIDHSLIATGCGSVGCHADDRARAANHSGLITCESCHRYPSWTSVTMNHSAIGTTLCKSCHMVSGTATAPPADQIHANIGSQDCSACHSTTTFAGATGVDHSSITTGCGAVGCHADDRTRAPNHSALNSCESCHRYPSWISVNMNHSAIGTTLCRSCHTRGGIAIGPPNDSRHNNLGTRDCDACHNTRNFD